MKLQRLGEKRPAGLGSVPRHRRPSASRTTEAECPCPTRLCLRSGHQLPRHRGDLPGAAARRNLRRRPRRIVGNWLRNQPARPGDRAARPRWRAGAQPRTGSAAGRAPLDRANIRAAIEGSLDAAADRLHRSLPAALAGTQPADVRPVDAFDPAKERAWNADPTPSSRRWREPGARRAGCATSDVSNEHPWGVMHFVRLARITTACRACMSIQNAYSLLNRVFEYGLAEILLPRRTLACSPTRRSPSAHLRRQVYRRPEGKRTHPLFRRLSASATRRRHVAAGGARSCEARAAATGCRRRPRPRRRLRSVPRVRQPAPSSARLTLEQLRENVAAAAVSLLLAGAGDR
ncbi:MAG: hypothetical protein MZW92_17580 [Comamonadaceae bacterium]|nr:hypothetical protein [Comamonadaceae bacterium]